MPTIDLPTNFVASTTAQISTLLDSFSPYFILVLGLIGVAVIAKIIIGAMHGK